MVDLWVCALVRPDVRRAEEAKVEAVPAGQPPTTAVALTLPRHLLCLPQASAERESACDLARGRKLLSRSRPTECQR